MTFSIADGQGFAESVVGDGAATAREHVACGVLGVGVGVAACSCDCVRACVARAVRVITDV